MTASYKVGDIAYMVEGNHYIREGKITHISRDLITFKFGDCMGATKIKAHRLYPSEGAALAAISKSKQDVPSYHIFNFATILASFLHLGQNRGEFANAVSA